MVDLCEMSRKVFITQPLLPNLSDVNRQLLEIWTSKWVTNNGVKHNELECRLKNALKVHNVSLFNNGTIALLCALKAVSLPYGSEIITTPFTFAATPHCISWNGYKPVFCDIEPHTMTIDVDRIEELITPNTSAILGVHVYGFPCDIDGIERIAKKHNLKVIYDAAHAFSTEIDGKGIGTFGDITMFSFHATKLFTTVEGGCLTFGCDDLLKRINLLRNFGIRSEEVIDEIGINGKMNEIQAAIGLLNLDLYKKEQAKRSEIKFLYDNYLHGARGIRIPQLKRNVSNSFQYYPIIIEDDYKISRDELYENLKKHNIYARKYFYPACSDYECYKNCRHGDLAVTNDIKNKVLCLPYYGGIEKDVIKLICEIINDAD